MDKGVSRRGFVRTVGGAAAVGATAGTAIAQEERPDFEGYLSGANVGSYADRRGESAVTVEVGAGQQGLAFDPTALWIDPGTTVTWEWTGEGGGHNVQIETAPDATTWAGNEEIINEAGYTHDHTFEAGGIYEYYCQPHRQLGMLGGLAVGEEVPTTGGGSEGGTAGGPAVGSGAKTLMVATMAAFGTTLSLAYLFLKYGGNPPREPGAEA